LRSHLSVTDYKVKIFGDIWLSSGWVNCFWPTEPKFWVDHGQPAHTMAPPSHYGMKLSHVADPFL